MADSKNSKSEDDVIITGAGPVSALGLGYESFRAGVVSGRSCGERLDQVETELSECPLELDGVSGKVGAPIKGEEEQQLLQKLGDLLTEKQEKRLGWGAKVALVAVSYALDDAGLDLKAKEEMYEVPGLEKEQTGVYVGSNLPGGKSLQKTYHQFVERGGRGVSAFSIPKSMPNQPASVLSLFLDLKGPSRVISTACASGNDAIGHAFDQLKLGRVDQAIVGGVESVIEPLPIAGFDRIQATSANNDNPKEASRPFDEDRAGFIYGEGAGFLVLEKRKHAEQRDAPQYAELAGYGSCNDSHHITAPLPEGEGAARAVKRALEHSGLNKEEIGYVNAHGTGTQMNDAMETAALKRVFGDHAYSMGVSSLKSQIGHPIGAAGGLEAIATLIAFRENQLPPTINLDNPDLSCDLDYIPHEPRGESVQAALSNSFGFGGHNTTIALRRA